MSPLVLSSGLKRRFPCVAFSKLPQYPRISFGNAGFLTSSGVQCWGACVATRISRKPWPRYSLTNLMMDPVFYGLRCSSRASSGGTTLAAMRPGLLLLLRQGPRRRERLSATLGILGSCYSMAVRRLCRAVTPLNGWTVDHWTMAVSGVSKTNGLERLAWVDLHEITPGRGFKK